MVSKLLLPPRGTKKKSEDVPSWLGRLVTNRRVAHRVVLATNRKAVLG